MSTPIGRCIGCFHDFTTGPCGGCGARPGPSEQCPSNCADDLATTYTERTDR